MGIFEKFKFGFKKSAENIKSGLREIIVKKEIDDETLNKIEEFLISSDVGIDAASEIKSIIAEKKIDPNNKTVDEINLIWSEFVSSINSQRPSIGSTLDNAKPTKIDQNLLTITVSGLPEFSVDNLNHNKEFIENSINQKLDHPVKLHFNWNDNISNEPIISSKPPETIQDSTKADKVIEKIIEEFDGEILR